jgi:hypothetical protein
MPASLPAALLSLLLPPAPHAPSQSPPQLGDVATAVGSRDASGDAAVDIARESLQRAARSLERLQQQLRSAKASLDTQPSRQAVIAAKSSSDLVVSGCEMMMPMLSSVECIFKAVLHCGSTADVAGVCDLLQQTTTIRSEASDLLCAAKLTVSAADTVLIQHVPPRHDVSMLDFHFADAVLDDICAKLVQLEEAAQATAAKKARKDSSSKALSRLQEVIHDKITGARRMLHLKRTLAADGCTYWRGRELKDEELLQALLSADDVNGNVVFTKLVDSALQAHMEKYADITQVDEKLSVALMWTDPLAIILRQLAHIDAVHGQAISVTALSKLVDAFIVLRDPPDFTADQVLLSLGLQPDDLVWLKDHMPDVHTKAKEYSLLPLPELCERFMADVVEPGACSRTRRIEVN